MSASSTKAIRLLVQSDLLFFIFPSASQIPLLKPAKSELMAPWWSRRIVDDTRLSHPHAISATRRGEAEKWQGILMGVLWWLIRWGGRIIFHLVTEQQYMWCAFLSKHFCVLCVTCFFFRFFFSVCLWAGYFQSWDRHKKKNEHKCERYLFAVWG